MNEELNKCINLLPKYEEIQHYLQNEAEAEYILQAALKDLPVQNQNDDVEEAEAYLLVQALSDKFWERIHTGHFSEVPITIRKIYALSNYLLIFYLLFESVSPPQVERCVKLLDEAILVGCVQDLYSNSLQLRSALSQLFNKVLNEQLPPLDLPILKKWQRLECACDIQQLNCPALETFNSCCFQAQQPALLLQTIEDWPALQLWRNLNYILQHAGNRIVPIEIGSSYAQEDWSQQMVKIRDFMQRQFGSNSSSPAPDSIEYLAQHNLFEQIPELRKDIRLPQYCALGTAKLPVDIKAWLGPQGTISPLHYDPKHNLLCQVLGAKQIILAAPTETHKLYAHETEFLHNTSQIDAGNLNLHKYPLLSEVSFLRLTLQPGDCLYIPPKWWHYVRAESASFSVSFWFD